MIFLGNLSSSTPSQVRTIDLFFFSNVRQHSLLGVHYFPNNFKSGSLQLDFFADRHQKSISVEINF